MGFVQLIAVLRHTIDAYVFTWVYDAQSMDFFVIYIMLYRLFESSDEVSGTTWSY